ncbi:hypothetical protein BD324DRAFT_651264 [Kockovaella imperatae]|uniref:Uncharacterized protein n=1 Tax=Kockovaella imperatae TaxID=4999 RepID=A0A1Y1UFD8_9TREE|nr:hypothetical protein BD324DRAFT_651264 [Kockovaella imperatae]ORX36780.1 hypothetical protein BD324DRAFT_651264 [Kockovaella imperatae]
MHKHGVATISHLTSASGTASAKRPTTTVITPYSYATSKIVKTAVAAGVIVLALCGLMLFLKISGWIRYHQRLRRQRYMNTMLLSEQRTNAYEIAAWSDEPGTAPITTGGGTREKSKKEKRGLERAQKRAGVNAHAIHEWEGVAS